MKSCSNYRLLSAINSAGQNGFCANKGKSHHVSTLLTFKERIVQKSGRYIPLDQPIGNRSKEKIWLILKSGAIKY